MTHGGSGMLLSECVESLLGSCQRPLLGTSRGHRQGSPQVQPPPLFRPTLKPLPAGETLAPVMFVPSGSFSSPTYLWDVDKQGKWRLPPPTLPSLPTPSRLQTPDTQGASLGHSKGPWSVQQLHLEEQSPGPWRCPRPVVQALLAAASSPRRCH